MKNLLFVILLLIGTVGFSQTVLTPLVWVSNDVNIGVEAYAAIDTTGYVDFPCNFWVELMEDTVNLVLVDSTDPNRMFDKNHPLYQYEGMINGGFNNLLPQKWYYCRAVLKDTFGTYYYSHYVPRKTGGVLSGLEKVNQEQLLVYPNPCNDIVSIKNGVDGEINFYSIDGKLCFTPLTSLVDVSALLPGMYIVEIKDKENTTYSRLLKH